VRQSPQATSKSTIVMVDYNKRYNLLSFGRIKESVTSPTVETLLVIKLVVANHSEASKEE